MSIARFATIFQLYPGDDGYIIDEWNEEEKA